MLSFFKYPYSKIACPYSGVMETYLDYAAFRGNMDIFKHIYYLSTLCKRPRKVQKNSDKSKLLKNTKGRSPDFFAKGAFKQKVLEFMQQNQKDNAKKWIVILQNSIKN